jgi:hypothetical protein
LPPSPVHRAVVLVFAWLLEGEAELVVGVKRLRTKGVVDTHHSVRHIVIIHPDHLGAGRDDQIHRRESEVVDLDSDRCRRLS